MTAGRRRAALLACVLAGAGVRGARLLEAPFLHADSPALLRIARDEIGAGHWRAALAGYYPPLYPAAVRAAHTLGLEWDTAGRAVSYTAGVATVALAGGLGTAILGDGAGIGAAALAAVHPGLVHASAEVLAESLYAALVGLWALLVLPGAAPATVRLALGGFVGAVAALARAEGIALVPLAALAGAWGAASGARLRRALVPLAAAALVALPVVLAVRLDTGTWAVSGKEAPVVLRKYGVAAGGIAALLVHHPGAFLAVYPRALARQIEYDLGATHWVLVVPLALGLAASVPATRRARGLVLATLAVFTLGIPILAPGKRYVVPLVPLLLPWVTPGLARLAAAARAGGLPAAARYGVAGAVVAGLLAQDLWPPQRDEEACYRDVCAFVATRSSTPPPAILADDGRIAWVCGTRFALRPRGADKAALGAAARAAAAGLVIVPAGTPAGDASGLVRLGTRCSGPLALDVLAIAPTGP
ncbi:MAG: hypothetical protein U0807_05880 [Candidatus Binatia bacterium]